MLSILTKQLKSTNFRNLDQHCLIKKNAETTALGAAEPLEAPLTVVPIFPELPHI
jgi:hypothetical protein